MRSKGNRFFEGLKQAGLGMLAILVLGGVGLLLGSADALPDTVRITGGIILAVAVCVLSGPVPTLLTVFDISTQTLQILWATLIVPYWITLGSAVAIYDRLGVPGSSQPTGKRTRWRIQILAVIFAAIFFLSGPIGGINWVSYDRNPPRVRIINNLRQLDAAKQQLALHKNLSIDYVPTENELLPYLGRGKPELTRLPHAGPERYVINPLAEKPYAALDSDWRIRRRGWREGYTITNGTIWRLP